MNDGIILELQGHLDIGQALVLSLNYLRGLALLLVFLFIKFIVPCDGYKTA